MYWTVLANFLALWSLAPKPLLFPQLLSPVSWYRLEYQILRLLCLLIDSCIRSLHVPFLRLASFLLFLNHLLVRLVPCHYLASFLAAAGLTLKRLLDLSGLLANARHYDLIIDIVFDALAEVAGPELLQIKFLKTLDHFGAVVGILAPLKHLILALLYDLI